MRVLAIALVPCIALLVTGGTLVGLRLYDGVSARDWSRSLSIQVDPFLGYVAAVQSERTESLRAVSDSRVPTDLQATRDGTDAAVRKLSDIARALSKLNPEVAAKPDSAFRLLVARVPAVRRAVDTQQAEAAEIDEFYTQLAGVIALGFNSSARSSPDPQVVAEEIVVGELIQITDLHARAIGRVVGTLAGGGILNSSDRLTYTRLVGAFHSRLEAAVSQLTVAEQKKYGKLIASTEWQSVIAAEGRLGETGKLPLPLGEWLDAQEKVSAELRGLCSDHFRHAERSAIDAADALLARAIAACIAVLLAGVVSFVTAIRLARTMIRRLRSLRAKTLELADQTLPSIVERLRAGEHVDVDAELMIADDGIDEIGQVAEAFNTAQRTAVTAAEAEARTRGGVNRVFLDIARRSQVVIHQQLSVLDAAEAKQNDPEHLELLFQLDHLTTRARRNAENLLILGGSQPGRKWRKPVSLEEIVRSAISETRDFTRVSAVRLPKVYILGAAVADLVHLLAELIDNAATFSPPDSPVSVRGNLVGKGVVVEVEDQGLGIRFEERERLNEVLREPPDFQEMALVGHRNLGLFVIGQLAQRHSIAVNLLESAYGGIKAIALVPAKLLDHVEWADPMTGEVTPADIRSGGRHHWPVAGPQFVSDPVPGIASQDRLQLPPWPPAKPPAGTQAINSVPAVNSSTSMNGRKKAPLPRRQRQTHLAPQLQLEKSEPAKTMTSTRSTRRRNPDEARSAMASFQRGTREGRDSDVRPMD
ncbi:nitrate- and nitrite sensing domain-containing protein [Nocardia sp. NBC_00508]|uniref:sensor histidine kinase n=1 Tax=Nocardia sp. NBC_00508 TaxID=2975992 RepID=UPI002E7FB9D5|nr:nitrate- and nitrite sensing domain-containing protein [Nocardia sp. NBC_00508]WUD66710.1 nitrate- and nitrite sensing domain-containing protein [Nocardia sp. NBC_00508]